MLTFSSLSILFVQHSVTAVNGVTARKAFYDGKALDFREGYMILSGRASPPLPDHI